MTNQQTISMLQDYRSLVSEMIDLKRELAPQQVLLAMKVQMLSEVEILRETHVNLTFSINQLQQNGEATL